MYEYLRRLIFLNEYPINGVWWKSVPERDTDEEIRILATTNQQEKIFLGPFLQEVLCSFFPPFNMKRHRDDGVPSLFLVVLHKIPMEHDVGGILGVVESPIETGLKAGLKLRSVDDEEGFHFWLSINIQIPTIAIPKRKPKKNVIVAHSEHRNVMDSPSLPILLFEQSSR